MAISNIGVISVCYRLPPCFVVYKVILFRCTASVHVATQPPHRWRENGSPVSSSAGL